ncbi:MAG: O-antigen ligase family protein, partial [Candidatus Aminicenantes bacterium]|nr:O-antigen ligase family protein [Candidatus Aminicenantes bacterium]
MSSFFSKLSKHWSGAKEPFELDALSRRRGRVVTALAALAAAAAYAFFYYKYVPLVPGFQAILAPVLAGVFLATYSSVERGLLALVFVLPLINNLPYWFGIHLQTPHAPTALPLILTFGLGLIVRKAVFPSGPDAPCRPLPLRRPIAGLSALIVLSAVINLLRHMDFFPFRSDGILELVVNAGGVRAGGAIMSTVFSSLSYLTGFFLFAAVYRAAENRAFIHRLLRVLAVAALLSLLFAVIQKTWAPGLGNTPYWVHFGQINGTFKDPNSFGGFLAAFVPLALGLAFSARGGARVLGFAVAALALAIFPAAGSRSSLLAMAAGLILFFGAAVYQISRRGFAARRRRQIVAVVLVLAVAALGFFGSKLHTRLSWSIEALTGRLTLGEFFNYRLTLWSAAFRMIAAYPLTGVGVGGFIIELPNTLAAEATGRIITDSALNYFFQGGAELGTAGLALLFWIFGALAWRMIRTAGRFSGGEARPDFIAIGAAAGVAAFLVSFVFHSYIGSFEVIGFFWLLAALL